MLITMRTFMYLLLSSFLYSFNVLLCFFLEDIFDKTTEFYFPLDGYTKCIAVMFITALAMLVYFFIDRKIYKNKKREILSLEQNIVRFIIIAASLITIYHISCLLHAYLVCKVDLFIVLKTIVTVSSLLFFIAYLIIDNIKIADKNTTLFYYSSGSFICICLIVAVIILNKYANLESIRRIYADIATYRTVHNIKNSWKHDTVFDINSKRYQNVSCKIVDNNTLSVTFQVVSNEQDAKITRIDERGQGVTYPSYRSKYKIPGSYTIVIHKENNKKQK